jgi:hypothetical protein
LRCVEKKRRKGGEREDERERRREGEGGRESKRERERASERERARERKMSGEEKQRRQTTDRDLRARGLLSPRSSCALSNQVRRLVLSLTLLLLLRFHLLPLLLLLLLPHPRRHQQICAQKSQTELPSPRDRPGVASSGTGVRGCGGVVAGGSAGKRRGGRDPAGLA